MNDDSIQPGVGKQNVELFLKLVPLSAGVIYLTGYLAELLFFRNINIQSIDFLEASLFETGITFFLLSFTVIGALSIFPILWILVKKGASFIPYKLGEHLIGVLFSIGAFLIVYFSTVYITLFLSPGEFNKISSYFFRLLLYGVVGFFVLLLVNMTTKKYEDSKLFAPNGFLNKEYVYNFADFIRLALFIVVGYNWYKIFIANSGVLIPVLDEINVVYYLIFLFLSSGLSIRLFTHMIHPVSYSKYAIMLLTPLAAIFFYLTVLSYVYGPFLYIPSGRGGGWISQSVSLVTDDKVLMNDKALFNGGNVSKKLFLLVDNDSSLYVAEYSNIKNQKDVFRYLRGAEITQIKADLIKELIYNK